MAAKTLTYTAGMGALGMSANVKGTHVGLQAFAFDFNSGASKLGTISDSVLLGKIPSGALITSKHFRFGVAGATSGGSWEFKLLVPENAGTLSSYATLISSMSAGSSAQTFSDFIPYKLSLSDDRAIQYAILALNCTTGPTETVSFSVQGFIHYSVDGSSL